MKFLILLSLTAVIVQANLIAEQQWTEFKAEHAKEYQNSVEERARFAIFQDNLKKISEHNKLYEQGLSTFKMGVNQFADLTEEEFTTLLGLDKFIPTETNIGDELYQMEDGEDIPESIDWRIKGAVTPVKFQATCASCWAFSATGALEGQNQILNKKLISLSEQQLIDCSTENKGCITGDVIEAFKYVLNNGITSEEKYPYKAKDGKCNYNQHTDRVLKITGYTGIPKNNELALKSAVAKVGPISATIYATSNLQLYSCGILDDNLCVKSPYLNHQILIVGYGKENDQEYWIIKNSWGAKWGEKGYFRYTFGKNMCGIASAASYPTL